MWLILGVRGKKKEVKSDIFLVLIIDMTHLQLHEWWKTCGGSKNQTTQLIQADKYQASC